VSGGQFRPLLRYAVGNIDRFKVRALFGARVSSSQHLFAAQEFRRRAAATYGRIASDTSVSTRQALTWRWFPPTDKWLVYDPNIGAYVYRYQDDQGTLALSGLKMPRA